jgi:hypothetical protein
MSYRNNIFKLYSSNNELIGFKDAHIFHSRTIADVEEVQRASGETTAASKINGELLAGTFVKTLGLKVDLEASGVTRGNSSWASCTNRRKGV